MRLLPGCWDVRTMADDLMEALTAPCGECGGGEQVTYCPAWSAYLCVGCRAKRNDDELRVRLVVKDLIAATAREITASARMVRHMQNRSGERGGNG